MPALFVIMRSVFSHHAGNSAEKKSASIPTEARIISCQTSQWDQPQSGAKPCEPPIKRKSPASHQCDDECAAEVWRPVVAELRRELKARDKHRAAIEADNRRLLLDLTTITEAYDQLQHAEDYAGSGHVDSDMAEESRTGGKEFREMRTRKYAFPTKIRSLQQRSAVREMSLSVKDTCSMGNADKLRRKVRELEEENEALHEQKEALEGTYRRASASIKKLEAQRRKDATELERLRNENLTMRESLVLKRCEDDIRSQHGKKGDANMTGGVQGRMIPWPMFNGHDESD
ncbi:hypothetical protein FOL47_007334 [Perkinsus chesapeaki]|uniref:Uncharacterized protein n=1 Tax=Perkinsus chesapeaki TaxID=330153 RepID=A0A7J6MW08_PERCH|nr:hypothetical protein FOL47_007334 [Perkinsus chesapeaki]